MKVFSLKKNVFLMIMLLPLLLFSSGCIYLVVGSVGAVGGYIVSPDTVEGLTEHDRYAVWEAAIEVVSIMGLIEEENRDASTLQAKINGARVTITIIPIGEQTVKLSVKARKFYLPKISLAQDIFVKIMNYVKS